MLWFNTVIIIIPHGRFYVLCFFFLHAYITFVGKAFTFADTFGHLTVSKLYH